MARDKKVPKDYFSFHLKILSVIGINIFEIENPFLRILYNVYAVSFIIFSFVVFTVCEFLAVLQNMTDLTQMSFALCYWISHFMGCLKLFIFLANKKNIKMYLKSFEEKVFKADVNRGGEKEIKIIKNAIWVANTQANVFYFVAISTILNRVVYACREEPLAYDIYNSVTNTTTSVVERTLPWKSWFWFDPKPTPNYQIAFVWQVWCVSLFGVEIGILDTLISAMMVHLNAQFSILFNAIVTVLDRAKRMQVTEDSKKDLQSLKHNNNLENAAKMNLSDEGWEIIPDHDETLKRNFETCVKICLDHHIKIIALSDNVEDQFNLMVLVQILGSTLIFCMQMVQLSSIPLFTTRFFSMISYMGLMIYQLGIYCYNGNEITIKSEDIATAAYNCDWIAAENRVKKYFILMMLRAQRPIKMSAGKFVFLSLATYMSLLRGSVSYYMVLRRKNEEDLQNKY